MTLREIVKKDQALTPEPFQVEDEPDRCSRYRLPFVHLNPRGVLGTKPFASGSLFAGDSSPNGPETETDDQRARLAIRYILSNPAITAPMPGLASIHQVDNMVKAIKERRALDVAERAMLDDAMNKAWAKLLPDYRWLKDWEYV